MAAALHREEFKGVVRLVPASGERWLERVSPRFETRILWEGILDALPTAAVKMQGSTRKRPCPSWLLVLAWCALKSEAFEGVRDYLGSKGPYREPPAEAMQLPPPPPSCKPVLVTGVLRHGSRNPGKKDVRSYDALEAKFRGIPPALLPPELQWLPVWRNPYRLADAHLLVAAGAAEHTGIAARLRKHLPHLFRRYHSRHHRFRSSCHERAARSAHAFAQGLFGAGEAIHIVTPDCVRVAAVPEVGGDGQGDKGGEGWEVDKLTRFFDVCPKYTATKGDMLRERDAFLQGATVGNVVRRMQARLPAAVQLTREDVAALYTLCGFEVAHDNRTAHICSLFAEEEMEALEFLEDLKHFYKKSYGSPINAQMVCPLHHFLLRALQERAQGVTERAAELIFAHGETLLPLMTRLRLFQDSAPLTAAASRELVLHFCMSVAVPST